MFGTALSSISPLPKRQSRAPDAAGFDSSSEGDGCSPDPPPSNVELPSPSMSILSPSVLDFSLVLEESSFVPPIDAADTDPLRLLPDVFPLACKIIALQSAMSRLISLLWSFRNPVVPGRCLVLTPRWSLLRASKKELAMELPALLVAVVFTIPEDDLDV